MDPGSGFAAAAITSRLNDAQAKLVFTADWSWRRGRPTPLKACLDGALPACPTVRTVVVAEREGMPGSRGPIDVTWSDFAPVNGPVPTEPTSAEDVLLLGYTSGTTGKPKGAVHTHAGFLVKVASEVAYAFDVRRGDVFFWLTDMGWVMGPLSTFGTHALGATLLLYEGAPGAPGPGRVWALAARHNVTMLGVSPTLIRALKSHGDDVPAASDLLIRARVRVDRRAVGRGLLPVAEPGGRGRRGADHQLLRGHRGRRIVALPVRGRADQGVLATVARRWAWTSRCSTATGSPCASSSASWSAVNRGLP